MCEFERAQNPFSVWVCVMTEWLFDICNARLNDDRPKLLCTKAILLMSTIQMDTALNVICIYASMCNYLLEVRITYHHDSLCTDIQKYVSANWIVLVHLNEPFKPQITLLKSSVHQYHWTIRSFCQLIEITLPFPTANGQHSNDSSAFAFNKQTRVEGN